MTLLRINNRILKRNGTLLVGVDKYNPLNLPPFTMRVEFYGDDASFDPTQYGWVAGTWTSAGGSVWDWTYQNAVWSDTVRASTVLTYYNPATSKYINLATKHFNILGANTTGVTNMAYLFNTHRYIQSIALFDTSNVTDMTRFLAGHTTGAILTDVPHFDTSKVTNMSYMLYNCRSIQSVPLFDTSSVTDARYMFYYCSGLQTVPLLNTSSMTNVINMFQYCTSLRALPLFDTSSMTNVRNMFYGCSQVESGALALYNQMSTQVVPPTNHGNCFTNCGSNTTTGAAELAQIPTSWGGTMS